MKKILLTTVAAITLAGCSVLGPVSESSSHAHLIYNKYPIQNCGSYELNTSLQLYNIDNALLFNNTNMYYMVESSTELNHYKLNNWINVPNSMLTDDLANYLISNCVVKSVTSSASITGKTNYSLGSYLVDLRQVFSKDAHSSSVSVRIMATLVNNKTNQLVFSNMYSYVESSVNTANGMSETTSSIFRQYNQDVTKDMLQYIK